MNTNSNPHPEFPIRAVEVSAHTIPTDLPESDGTLEWDKTTIVVVEVHAATESGIGYTYASLSTATLIEELLRNILKGRDALDISTSWLAMVRAIRNLGRSGICSMAISAVDIALWDLKAKLLNLPLVELLGACREEIPIYGSGGFTSYTVNQLQRQLGGWVNDGFKMVKMKIGRDACNDPQRVHAARTAIGDNTQLFVDANGAYNREQSVLLAERFEEDHVTWFEEPVSSDDLEGLRFVRDRGPSGMEIAAGEYGYDWRYFLRMLQSEAVDVLQADATRCAGITGFLQAAALCETHSTPLSAHTAPTVHMHVCCAVPAARHVEYFHDHARIERMLFEGFIEPWGGALKPDLSRPGLGIKLRRPMAQHRADI